MKKKDVRQDDEYTYVHDPEYIAPQDDGSHKYFKTVPSYHDLLRRDRPNFRPQGYDFDVDVFENFIDSFVPEKTIPTLLRTTEDKLNEFCMAVYNMSFHETYVFLSGVTDAVCRRSFTNLAKSGNTTAMSIVSKHFMGLKDEDQTSNVNVTFVNDLGKGGNGENR